ncbi:hypothetical protein FXO37_17671 [Capsicum annuum]|nr:hypothetical protein FXO37_17671 [Capsicum annuum]
MTVTETRYKSMEDFIKKVDTQLQSHIVEAEKKFESHDAKLDDLRKKLDVLMEHLISSQKGILGSGPRDKGHSEGPSNRVRMREQMDQGWSRNPGNYHYPKVEFPFFDGTDPCSWLHKGERTSPMKYVEEVPNTIRLQGEAKKNKVTILLNSGSTHSFLDMDTAKKIGCNIQGVEFVDSIRLVRLGGNDIILGGDWMKDHNPVLLDFVEYKVEVTHKAKRVELKGIVEDKEVIPCEIQLILDDFPDVFVEPKTLPPQRGHDNHIPLKKDANQLISDHTGHLTKSLLRISFPYPSRRLDEIDLRAGSTILEHLNHPRKVLMVLRHKRLFAKMSKCSFGQSQMEYLGHIITGQGVSPDPAKINAMVNWPKPKSLKSLRGFQGLTGYYRRFVQSYGIISRPLTNMLNKNAFQWNEEIELAFERLKEAMTTVLVLALDDFTKPFIIETDACSKGMGAVLKKEERPLAYFSKALGARNLGLSTYEKEYMDVLAAVDRWKHYLQGGHFIIRTDHQSLK